MNGNYCTLTFTETFRKWSLDIQAGKYFAWKTLLSAIFLCLPLFSGCNAEETAKVPPGSKKILIAVFSYTGNTRRVAEAIRQKTGGTLIEIEPETPYSKDYQAVVKQGKEEVDSGFLPKLKTKAANIRDYDVIFVGSPIWWYTIAPPVASFLHDHDLSGKTVVPFFTHGGYGIGHSLKDIRKYAPGAVLAGEFELDRDSLKKMDARITKWLKEIGVGQMTGNKQKPSGMPVHIGDVDSVAVPHHALVFFQIRIVGVDVVNGRPVAVPVHEDLGCMLEFRQLHKNHLFRISGS